ncbi:MAG: arginine decarboxylase [Saprospiraceae bacterium]
MNNQYFDLIDQSYYFPQDGFDLDGGELTFHGISLKYLIEKYGTPLKLTYLPKISMQIKRAKNHFNRAIKSLGYGGKYHYCYCTKSNHFSYILDEVLKNEVHLETSSSFDIDIINNLHQRKKITKKTIIINNGYKTEEYVEKIGGLIKNGFKNIIPVCDNIKELELYEKYIEGPCKIGIRVATEEEPKFEFYTSRLGIRKSEVLSFYEDKIANNDKFQLKMLHFFVDTGIKDSIYYWGELKKAVKTYCELKKVCKDLKAINIGGGMPIRNSLGFEFDYKGMIKEIVSLIQQACEEEGIPDPDIFTEFGKYTVGESGATIFSILGQKQQNDSELWYIVDNSLMNTIPDSWGIFERFILLPINKWKHEYTRVNIGGLTCDNSDYYNSEVHENQVMLPRFSDEDAEPLYIGFFHTGAYQDALSGFGGIKHCLIPGPKQVIVNRDSKGNIVDRLYSEEQTAAEMLKFLGY